MYPSMLDTYLKLYSNWLTLSPNSLGLAKKNIRASKILPSQRSIDNCGNK